jgi:hypothetical protein
MEHPGIRPIQRLFIGGRGDREVYGGGVEVYEKAVERDDCLV